MKISQNSILNKMEHPKYRPMTFDELCHFFQIPQPERKLFRRVLKSLLNQNKIIRLAGKRYRLVSEEDFVTGIVKKHPKGFGFLIPDQKGQEDVFLSPPELGRVMNKDRLKVRVIQGRKTYGQVVEILERGMNQVMGRLFVKGRMSYIVPQGSESDHDNVLIPYDKQLLSHQKELVVCKIVKYPEHDRWAEGEIIKILGLAGEHAVDFSSMIYKYGLRHEFSNEVLHQASEVKKWNLSQEREKRKDLSSLPFMTIDGETAKDFDDAVCVQKLPNGHFKLWVAIADVSFFVRKNSALDHEAYDRATSVYFPGGVIPMLPEVLSNDLCSLNPNTEKMTFTCEMEFNSKGEKTNFSIYETIIRSQHRMTYTAIQAILDKDSKVQEQYKEIVHNVFVMNELKDLLKKQKYARGCLDFDLPEPEMILNMEGEIESIVKRSRLEAHMLIEEFMIAANETVAEFMYHRHRPFVYRVHEVPEADVLFEFHELCHNLGYKLEFQKVPNAKTYSRILEVSKGKPEEKVINNALLRSMKLARYDEKNLKHFGLASQCYTHFTSPIRRYPDLMVHRLLKEELKKKSKSSDTYDDEVLTQVAKDCDHCSRQERVVEEAEREFVDLKKCQFMVDKVGQEFEGYISHIAEFGFFVELDQIFVEGLVRVTSLQDDFYQFQEDQYLMRGRKTKKEFQLGQKVLVQVERVDLDKRQIDFILLES